MALRWALAGDEEAGALFPDERAATRHVGRGAYAGLEFLHVNARTIINAVPPQSLMPFRYTINPYRGCSHACSYCMGGETPILMGDGTTKPMARGAGGRPGLRHRPARRLPALRDHKGARPLVDRPSRLPDDA